MKNKTIKLFRFGVVTILVLILFSSIGTTCGTAYYEEQGVNTITVNGYKYTVSWVWYTDMWIYTVYDENGHMIGGKVFVFPPLPTTQPS
jgi:hypothetical protein